MRCWEVIMKWENGSNGKIYCSFNSISGQRVKLLQSLRFDPEIVWAIRLPSGSLGSSLLLKL